MRMHSLKMFGWPPVKHVMGKYACRWQIHRLPKWIRRRKMSICACPWLAEERGPGGIGGAGDEDVTEQGRGA